MMTSSQEAVFKQFIEACLKKPKSLDPKPKFDKLKKSDITKISEADSLSNGSLLESVIEKGYGTESPKSGDLVYFHYSLHIADDEKKTIISTRTENIPFVVILEKSPRLPRGLEISLTEMTRGERRVIKIEPDFAYQHPDCELSLPEKDKELISVPLAFDVTLVNWYSGYMSKVGGNADGWILKRGLKEGQGWENPRPPYQVEADVVIRKVSSDGEAKKGEVLFTANNIKTSMGKGTLPESIESGLTSMVTSETALFYISGSVFKNKGPFFREFWPEQGNGQIEVEIKLNKVTQVRDMYGDGKVMKHRVREGKGEFPLDCPLEDCKVKIHYKIKSLHAEESDKWAYSSRDTHKDPVQIELGCGELPLGLEACIQLMLPEEISEVECHPDLGYDAEEAPEQPPPGISKEDFIICEVELVEFERLSQWADFSATQALSYAADMKSTGNRLFQSNKISSAIKKYKKVIQNLESFRNFEKDEDYLAGEDIKLACYGNIASCYIRLNEYGTAIDWCNKTLALDEKSTKILLRRARAFCLNGDFAAAGADLDKALMLDGSLAQEVKEEKAKNKRLEINAKNKQKKEFKNFFER